MKQLHDKLIADLTAPRPLTDQVIRTLMDLCELQSNELPTFLNERSGEMDDIMVDTIFSPMYTPNWSDRARYVADRERVKVTPDVIGLMIQELSRAALSAQYQYEEYAISMPLPEVIIDRWVHRLQLDVQVPERIQKAIEATIPADGQGAVKALVGDAGWQAEGRDEILVAFLTGYSKNGRFAVDKFEQLTALVHTYRPHDLAHFAEQLDHLIQAYQEENNDGHFFDSHLKEAHGNTGGTHTPVSDSYQTDRQRQRALATQIQQDLVELLTPSS